MIASFTNAGGGVRGFNAAGRRGDAKVDAAPRHSILPMAFHSLMFRTFCQATEDEAKVIDALRFACGSDEIERSVSEGFHGNRILVLVAALRARKDIDLFFSRFDDEDLLLLRATLEERVDECGNLFLRLDKQKAFLHELKVSEEGDVISVRGSIKAYPKRRETALEIAREYLERLLGSPDETH
jgi:RNA binding exosome subunit